MLIALVAVVVCAGAFAEDDFMSKVENKYADSNGVKIHYAKAGKGPLIVFIHGFPDFWYTWHAQMEGLMDSYTVCAMDTRGYNLSDKPEKQEDYAMPLLIGDVAAVIKAEGQQKAVIVGHDWGGAIAWSFAAMMPQMTDKLIIFNLPHLENMARELANSPEQQKNSGYARNFQKPDSEKQLSATMLAAMVSHGDPDLKAKYEEAFGRSSLAGMMNYYRQNYPKADATGGGVKLPKIQMPVLEFHGLNDTALMPGGLNGTWEHLEKDWTLVTYPGVGHWSQQERAKESTAMIKAWLEMHK
jgi:pimeloyl-ACP methyl ester carboxylesterase